MKIRYEKLIDGDYTRDIIFISGDATKYENLVFIEEQSVNITAESLVDLLKHTYEAGQTGEELIIEREVLDETTTEEDNNN